MFVRHYQRRTLGQPTVDELFHFLHQIQWPPNTLERIPPIFVLQSKDCLFELQFSSLLSFCFECCNAPTFLSIFSFILHFFINFCISFRFPCKLPNIKFPKKFLCNELLITAKRLNSLLLTNLTYYLRIFVSV